MSIQIDVRDLITHPGSSRSVTVAEPIDGLDTTLAHVPSDELVGATLLFENVVEGILVSGEVRGSMRLECARCLRPFDQSFDLHVQELFVVGAPAHDDEYPLVEGFVDLEPMFRDAIVLAMPFSPLCRDDCAGLCARCGGDLNSGECTCAPEVDERWAPLLSIDFGMDRGPFDGERPTNGPRA